MDEEMFPIGKNGGIKKGMVDVKEDLKFTEILFIVLLFDAIIS